MDGGNAETREQLSAKAKDVPLYIRGFTSRFKRLGGFVNGATREFFGSLIKTPDYLCAIGRIDTFEYVAGGDTFAADNERILASKLALDLLNRIAHRLRVFFFSEIGKRFVTKF